MKQIAHLSGFENATTLVTHYLKPKASVVEGTKGGEKYAKCAAALPEQIYECM